MHILFILCLAIKIIGNLVHYVSMFIIVYINQTHLLLGLLFDGSQGLRISEIVDGDSQEHVQEDICVAIFVKDWLKFIKSVQIDITREGEGTIVSSSSR